MQSSCYVKVGTGEKTMANKGIIVEGQQELRLKTGGLR